MPNVYREIHTEENNTGVDRRKESDPSSSAGQASINLTLFPPVPPEQLGLIDLCVTLKAFCIMSVLFYLV